MLPTAAKNAILKVKVKEALSNINYMEKIKMNQNHRCPQGETYNLNLLRFFTKTCTI